MALFRVVPGDLKFYHQLSALRFPAFLCARFVCGYPVYPFVGFSSSVSSSNRFVGFLFALQPRFSRIYLDFCAGIAKKASAPIPGGLRLLGMYCELHFARNPLALITPAFSFVYNFAGRVPPYAR